MVAYATIHICNARNITFVNDITFVMVAYATIHICNARNITFVNDITFVMVAYATIVMTSCLLYNCNTHRISGAHPPAWYVPG